MTQRIPTTLREARLAVLRDHTELAQLIDELDLSAKAVLSASWPRKPSHSTTHS